MSEWTHFLRYKELLLTFQWLFFVKDICDLELWKPVWFCICVLHKRNTAFVYPAHVSFKGFAFKAVKAKYIASWQPQLMRYHFAAHGLLSSVRTMWPGETLGSFMWCSFSMPRCYSAFTQHVDPRHLGTCFLAAILLVYKYCRRISPSPPTVSHMSHACTSFSSWTKQIRTVITRKFCLNKNIDFWKLAAARKILRNSKRGKETG